MEMETLNHPPIAELVPHSGPMILLDRLVEPLEDGCVCERTIGSSGLLIEEQGLPAYVGIELMAQSIAAYSGYTAWRQDQPVQLGFLIAVPAWKTECDHFPSGRTLRIHVRREWGDDQLLRFAGEIRDAETEKLLQTAAINVYQPADPAEVTGAKS